MNLSSTKSYGGLVVLTLLLIWLWSSWDAQAGMHHPGWFAGLRRNVWCQTVLTGEEFGTATFSHYPGKRLSRLMDDLRVPWRYQALYRQANARITVCHLTFKDAAKNDKMFYAVTKDYPDILAGWTEEDYQQAVLLLHLQPKGPERLGDRVKLEQRLKEQETAR